MVVFKKTVFCFFEKLDLCLLGLGFPWQKNSLDVREDSTLCDGDS